MIYIISIIAFIGFISALVARYGVHSEKRKLTGQKIREELLGPVSKRKHSQQALEKWLVAHGAMKNGRQEARVGAGRHLQLRMKTIYEALSHNEEARVMPSLHDLHTLTMQDESSRVSSTALRTITSFLLIVGILGTLWGVHSVLDATDVKMNGLKEALEPSMLAVACTVVLMWLRGWYVASFDAYLESLDLFTMTEVIPSLQPESRVGNETGNFEIGIENLMNKIESVKQMATDMTNISEEVTNVAKEVASISDKIDKVQNDVQQNYQSMADSLTESAKRFEDIRKAVRGGDNAHKEFDECIAAFNQQIIDITKRCSRSAQQYEFMTTAMTVITDQIEKAEGVFSQLMKHAVSMKEVGTHVEGYKDSLDNISTEINRVNIVLNQMNELKTKLGNSDNLVYNSAVTAQEALEQSNDCMKTLKAYNDDFSAHIDIENSRLQQALAALEGRVSALKKNAGELHALFEKRSEILHI